ncbi:MAG: type III secretion system cytoplasmic ring protein SctQ [Myxococcaceae bacterium]|nr:type III secretion system cytoplasmic ring protein SctQ [Myxococcaceae bacterium]
MNDPTGKPRRLPPGNEPTLTGVPLPPELRTRTPATGTAIALRGWQPFRFDRLPPVSKAQAKLLTRVEWVLPGLAPQSQVLDAVRARLTELFEEDVTLRLEQLQMVPLAEVKRFISEPTFLAVLAPPPNKTRGFIEVELGLAHVIIDKLLGGAGDAVAMRALTDIEEGVLMYVLLEVMRMLAPHVDSSLPRLRLENVVRGFEEAQALIAEEPLLAVAQLHASVGGQTGFVRLFIPGALLSASQPPPDAHIRRVRRQQQALAHAQRLAAVPVALRVEIGQVEISARDIAAVREGDVVVVDALSCRADKGENGTARLKVGRGNAGHVEVEVALENGHYQAKVTAFSWGDEVRPGSGAPGEGAPSSNGRPTVSDASQGPEGVELLNDIPLQISVELARVSVTAEDVVALKVGQVIDLNRGAKEPMDLSVNGKVVARGELVEIEGNLGVRILSLVG